MPHTTFDEAADIYRCAADHAQESITVENLALRSFTRAVARLQWQLGEQTAEDEWQKLLSSLRRYLFSVRTAPVPLNWSTEVLLETVQVHARWYQYSYPQLLPYLEAVRNRLISLAQMPDNPLLIALQDLARTHSLAHGALLLKSGPGVATVRQLLGQIPELAGWSIVNEYSLRLPGCYDFIVAVGPRDRFPGYVFSSPRAPHLYSVRYKWPKDHWTPQQAFIGSLAPVTASASLEPDDGEPQGTGLPDEDDASLDDWAQYLGPVYARQAHRETGSEDADDTGAYLVLLADDHAVWIDADSDTKVLVLDLDEDVGDSANEEEGQEHELAGQVARRSPDQLRPGMFLLLRTSGGGDYISPVADRLLGQQAQSLRAMQEEWKGALRSAARASDLTTLSIELLYSGSKRANEMNVRNWKSPRNIKPRDYADFLAIMKQTGLEAKAQEYWHAASQIDAAHRRAGHRLRKLLLKQVEGTDLTALMQSGRLDFHVPDVDGGGLTAFRIEHFVAEAFLVPASRIGRPFVRRER